jgi:hypothetical protein
MRDAQLGERLLDGSRFFDQIDLGQDRHTITPFG